MNRRRARLTSVALPASSGPKAMPTVSPSRQVTVPSTSRMLGLAGKAEPEADRAPVCQPSGTPERPTPPSDRFSEGDGEAGAVLHAEHGVDPQPDAHVALAGEPQQGRDVHAVAADDLGAELELQAGIGGEDLDEVGLLDPQQDERGGGARRGVAAGLVVEQPHLAEEAPLLQPGDHLLRLARLVAEDGDHPFLDDVEGVDLVPLAEDQLVGGMALLFHQAARRSSCPSSRSAKSETFRRKSFSS